MIMTSKSNETQCFIPINACSCRSIRKWDTFIVMISSIVCRVTLWRPWSWSNYEISCKQWIYLKHVYITTLRPKKKVCFLLPERLYHFTTDQKKIIGIFTIFSFAWNVKQCPHALVWHPGSYNHFLLQICKPANILYKKKKLTYRPIIFSARNRKHT